MSSKRSNNYQSGTSRPEHRLPSVFDGEEKKMRQKRQKKVKQTVPEFLVGPPLPDLPEYKMEYKVPPTPGFGFEPEPLPPNDPDQFIGVADDFIQVPDDPMEVDEPDVPSTDNSTRLFGEQLAGSQHVHSSFRYFNPDPISAFLDPISEPEYHFEDSF